MLNVKIEFNNSHTKANHIISCEQRPTNSSQSDTLHKPILAKYFSTLVRYTFENLVADW